MVNNFLNSLPHLVMAIVVVGAVSALAAIGVITGGEAVAMIGTASGFTLGGAVASGSASAGAENIRGTLTSTGAQVTTQTTVHPATNDQQSNVTAIQ